MHVIIGDVCTKRWQLSIVECYTCKETNNQYSHIPQSTTHQSYTDIEILAMEQSL